MRTITSISYLRNREIIPMDTKWLPSLGSTMDEMSPAKYLAGAYATYFADQLRYSSQLGWLLRDGNVWRPDERQAMQIARQFCAEAGLHMRDRRLDTEATVETVLRLAAFEPGMRAPLPKGDVALTLSAQRRVA